MIARVLRRRVRAADEAHPKHGPEQGARDSARLLSLAATAPVRSALGCLRPKSDIGRAEQRKRWRGAIVCSQARSGNGAIPQSVSAPQLRLYFRRKRRSPSGIYSSLREHEPARKILQRSRRGLRLQDTKIS